MAKASMKRSALEKALAVGNRLATGAPKGRKETDSPTAIKKARDKYGSKLKAPPVSKERKVGVLGRATDRRIARRVAKAGG